MGGGVQNSSDSLRQLCDFVSMAIIKKAALRVNKKTRSLRIFVDSAAPRINQRLGLTAPSLLSLFS